jgi:hypothetical protein
VIVHTTGRDGRHQRECWSFERIGNAAFVVDCPWGEIAQIIKSELKVWAPFLSESR